MSRAHPAAAQPPPRATASRSAATSSQDAAASLTIDTEQSGPASVRVRLTGEIDLATAPQLRAALLSVILAAPPRTDVRVDLSGVTFVDATGVGVLVRANRAARRAGLGFAVAHPTGMVLRILEVLDLTEVLAAGQPAAQSG